MIAITGYSPQVIGSCDARSNARRETADEALLKAIAAGDRRAMQIFYQRHSARVYRFVLRLIDDESIAEDLVSEVFLDVWRQADNFRAQSKVSTWLISIARHKALSALRRRSHEQLDERMELAIEDPADDAETMVRNEDRRAIIQTCLSQLSKPHQKVIDLVYYHERSIGEVAQIVGIPARTVKTRMFYARKQLKMRLARAGITEL